MIRTKSFIKLECPHPYKLAMPGVGSEMKINSKVYPCYKKV